MHQHDDFLHKIAVVQVVKVDPGGTSREYKYGRIDRDYNASLNILERGLKISGLGLPFAPVETERIRVIKYLQVLSYPQEPLQMPTTFVVGGGHQ